MKKQNKIIVTVILIVVLTVLMGIGYAALSNVTLTISGTASATASQDNFQVYFTGANTKESTDANVETVVSAKAKTATVNISNLSKKGDSEYAILEIENAETSVNATSVNVTAQGTDTNIFDISAQMCSSDGTAIQDYSLNTGAKTYVKVQATVLNTPTENSNTSIDVTITATPDEVTN